MKKKITFGIIALALMAGGVLTRTWAVNWPQSAFREWQTANNPIETLLEPLPDNYWWSGDVDLNNLAFRRGRAWTPVVLDAGQQSLPDPIVVVGRQNQLLFYRPNLPRGLQAGASSPVDQTTITFGGTNGGLGETGVLTTNPVIAESPAPPSDVSTGQPGARLVFVTHGLGVQSTGLTTDDPAYVQAVSVTATDSTTTVTTLGKLKIQQPLPDTTARETRITGMTFADIGDANTPLPLLFLTTADGQVVCVDTTKFTGTTANSQVDPKTAIRWRWTNPGPRVVVPAGGGTPNFPPNSSGFAPVPFNDGMNPAVGQVPLNGLPDLQSLSANARRTNQQWQDQVRLRNREWVIFVADRNANAWAIEAFGDVTTTTSNGQITEKPNGRARTRWTAKIPGGTLFPDRFAVPPLIWNGNTPTTDSTGALTGANNGYDDLVIFAGVNSVTAFDAQGHFLTADKPVFWNTSQFPPGVPPSLTAGSTLPPVTRKLGEADGTTQKRWQFPEVGASPPVDGRFLITVVRGMAGWLGARQFDNSGQDFANTAVDDDRIFIRWNEKYVRPLDRTANPPVEPDPAQSYVERLGALSPYGSIDTNSTIDTDKAVTVTFTKTTGATPTTYTIPSIYLSIRKDWEDTSRTDVSQRSHRGRITILKPVGLDNQDNSQELAPGDLVTVAYTAVSGGTQREQNVTYPSRRGQDVEPTVSGQTTPQPGSIVPTSMGRSVLTIEEEGTANDNTDERIVRSQTDDDYNPIVGSVTSYPLVPGMSVANDRIWFNSRYRGRIYVIEAQESRDQTGHLTLNIDGQLTNSAKENPTGGAATPDPSDDIPTAIDPIGNPAIADGWMYVSYGNGFLSAFTNQNGGGAGVEPPVGPFVREGNRRNAIPIPQIRVTDNDGNPITNEDKLRFDWGQPVKLAVTFDNFQADSLSLQTNPIRVTIRGPMGDLPPVTVSPSRQTTNGAPAGVAFPELIIPNATPSNPMTPGTPLLKDVPDVTKRAGIAHWELRVEQIGTNWLRPDDTVGPWEPDRDAATWRPERNTAPWFTLNNPIALVYDPLNSGRGQDIANIARFANAPTNRLHEGKNGDPYSPGQTSPVPDVKTPTVITVGTDPANSKQLLFAEHAKSSPTMVLGIVDRSDLGLRPSLGALRVRVQLPKVTKLGFPLMQASDQATGIPYGSVDQNYPDDGADGFYSSIPGERVNVVKRADASNAATGSVALRGVSTGSNDPNAPPAIGSDGYETKILQPELFNISVDVPAHQPDGIYATRSRLADPTTSSNGGPPVPSPATAINPLNPYRDFVPDDPNVDVNNPPVQLGLNDRPARVTVFIDANNNGRLDLQGNYREAYRTFALQLAVKPDMRLEAAAVAPRTGSPSRLVDLGKLWHGFQTPTWHAMQTGSIDAQGRAFFEQYWKPFVLLNTGNTNLIQVKPEVMLSAQGQPLGPVRLPSDGVDLFESLTLMRDPTKGGNPSNANQIYLRTSFDDQLQLEQGNYDKGGVWLQLARPGSSSPGTGLYAGNPAVGPNVTAYEPKLTLNVPMGTPLGTYSGDVRFFNDRKVSIVLDNSALGFSYQVEAGGSNRLLDRTTDQATGQLAALEPFSDPALTVKVRVTENVAAGSTGDASVRSQLGVSGNGLARTSPAAGVDLSTNRLFLFYASNQQGLTGSPANPLQYDIFGAGVPFDKNLGTFPFDPLPLAGGTWANLGRVSNQTTPNGVTVKNTKPDFAQDARPNVAANARAGYVFWHEEQAKGPGDTQARILYRRVTPSVGETQVLAPGGSPFQEGNVRQSPRAAAVPLPDGVRWFVFWNGSQQQKNNVFFSQSTDPETPSTWTPETLVPTSPSLATVQEASPAYVPSTGTLWLFYTGFNQKLGRSDVFATKLDPTKLGSRQVVENPDTGATVRALYGLLGFAPRLGEILRANPTRTTFTAAGVDWQVNDQNPAAIFINGYVPVPDAGSRTGTQVNGLQVFLNGQLVSGLTYRGLAANDEQSWSFQAPLAGGSTNTTVYVSIDGASGTVRFSLPPGRLALTGVAPYKENFPDPQVVADYIPGSLRLTNSDLGATGGVGFTTSTYEPSWYWNTYYNHQPPAQRPNVNGAQVPVGARADRLWAVWRRSSSATTLGPTLYYKTFRPGVQIVHPLRGATGTLYAFNVQLVQGNGSGPQEPPVVQDVDMQDGVLYFRQENEGQKVRVTVSAGGTTITETHYIGWREEGGESPVPMDVSVNEGIVTAFPILDSQMIPASQPNPEQQLVSFADPPAGPNGAFGAIRKRPMLSKIWLFWSSTRGSGSDIFHATIAPRLTPTPG
jgi:hypothetical protein